MSDLVKIIGILIALPAFILIVISLIISSWAEGVVIEEILQAFETSPIIIVSLSVIGVIVLIIAIFTLAKNMF